MHALDVQHLLADDVVIELLLRGALDAAAPAAARTAAAEVAHHAAHGEEKSDKEQRSQNIRCHDFSFFPYQRALPLYIMLPLYSTRALSACQ